MPNYSLKVGQRPPGPAGLPKPHVPELPANYTACGGIPSQCPISASSSYPDGHIDDLAAQVGNVLANVFGTELVCRTVEILRQLHADVVRAWLRAPVA
jgi:hypothetical protein